MKHTGSLLNNLISYSHSDYYPFHMPGHKRAALDFPNPWSVDITEIDGFDNLHHASGILAGLQEEAADLFGAQKSFCLVNGSTCGLLAAVSACVKPGGKLLMSRNCHKSVYHAVYLRNITPIYLMPKMTDFGIMGSLSPAAVEAALTEQPDIEAVLVVSPTYDGVVSDIKSIAAIAHAHGIPLIVDEAHGAHLPLAERCTVFAKAPSSATPDSPVSCDSSTGFRRFPASALRCGADVVIQSLHKTLPAFTQTALLHLNSDLVEESVIRRFLGIYQSSSPSYLLMASMDRCMQILRNEGAHLFTDFRRNLDAFYRRCEALQSVQVFRGTDPAVYDWDDSKLLISATVLSLSGQELYDILLHQYHLQLEMAAGHYALALTSLMDRPEGFERLSAALLELEQQYRALGQTSASRSVDTAKPLSDGDIDHASNMLPPCYGSTWYRIPQQKLTIAQALQPGRTVKLADAVGAVSLEYLYLYPPGIPLLAPGEVIDETLLGHIVQIKNAGLTLEGLADTTNTWIRCW